VFDSARHPVPTDHREVRGRESATVQDRTLRSDCRSRRCGRARLHRDARWVLARRSRGGDHDDDLNHRDDLDDLNHLAELNDFDDVDHDTRGDHHHHRSVWPHHEFDHRRCTRCRHHDDNRDRCLRG
jgi:hypothetical protein